jgi:exopolyphosphatase/guanosine-5'-triphosphate,3'-diphosphate pyrophosphatase
MSQGQTVATVPQEPARGVAVIDIGTTSIRMAIAEISPTGSVRKLESLSQAVGLGKDTFTQGVISRATIEECVRVLRSYRELLQEYQITSPDRIRVVATSAVREARNKLAFQDRVFIATGLDVQPLDEAEVNRITYLAIRPEVVADPALASSQILAVEVGGGSTELLLLRGVDVILAATFRLGSLRLRKTLEHLHTPQRKVRQIMETHIRRVVQQIRNRVSPLVQGEPIELLALGGDIRMAAAHLAGDTYGSGLVRLSVDKLTACVDHILGLSDEEIVHHYHTTFPDAETAGAALLSYLHLARAFERPSLLVSHANLRDGLLQEMAAGQEATSQLSDQLIRSAIDLGRKYQFDEAHARHVAELSRSLFWQLRDYHRLSPRHAELLYIAALLLEIGQFVSIRSHHKHALYLIRNSELFGLNRHEILLVALTARYHRRASPQPVHEEYVGLARDDRVAVAMMASLLRVAIALDDSRSQRIKEFHCNVENGALVIYVPGVEDLSVEQFAVRQSGSLFQETFGMPVLLRPKRTGP